VNAERFKKMVLENADFDYGIFSPPTKAQEGLTILINHFLGDNWYSVNPVSQEQVNTEAIYEILWSYPFPQETLWQQFWRKINALWEAVKAVL
jgi:hypothetical protein